MASAREKAILKQIDTVKTILFVPIKPKSYKKFRSWLMQEGFKFDNDDYDFFSFDEDLNLILDDDDLTDEYNAAITALVEQGLEKPLLALFTNSPDLLDFFEAQLANDGLGEEASLKKLNRAYEAYLKRKSEKKAEVEEKSSSSSATVQLMLKNNSVSLSTQEYEKQLTVLKTHNVPLNLSLIRGLHEDPSLASEIFKVSPSSP